MHRTREEPPRNKANFSIADWGSSRIGSPACALLPLACMGRLYKQTQFRRVATGLAVQTNPIPAAVPIGRSAFPGGGLCKTNPIPAGTGWREAWGTRVPYEQSQFPIDTE
jgi:hypothetical protein